MEFLRKNAVFVVIGILSLHFILGLVISSQESMTYDEKAHIPAAYSYVRYGDMRLNPEHPPLIKDLSGLPLLLLDVDFPLESEAWKNGYNEQWLVGDAFINCSEPKIACNDADTLLFFSRLPITVLAVILGVGIFLWTRKLGGALAGVFATALYAFDPNIIAHSHYVTTDIGSAAFIFFAFYFFIEFLKNPTGRTVLLSGIFLGLAELTKFSAVLLFPVFGLFTLLYALTRLSKPETISQTRFIAANLWRYLFGYTKIILVCFVIIWIGYRLNTLGMPAQKIVEHADLFLSQPNEPARIVHDLIVNMTTSPLLLPYAEYFVGLAKVFSRVAAGNVHYFLGTVSNVSSPWYFPVVFLLKETLPFLFLLVTTTCYGLFRLTRSIQRQSSEKFWFLFARSFQNHITEYLALFFVLFYSYVSITGNLTIGFRHLFPILPFLYLLVGTTLARFYKRHESEPATHRLISIFIGIIFFIVVAIPALTYPSYLSYFNAAAGGHTVGYRYVTDSNYDWGQDLKYLQKWVDDYNACVGADWIATNNGAGCQNLPKNIPTQMPIDKIRVDYFGGSDPKYYLGDKYIPWWGSRAPEAGWYAISSFFYQESLYKELAPGEENYTWLKDIEPLDRAGDSFFIYYFSSPPSRSR